MMKKIQAVFFAVFLILIAAAVGWFSPGHRAEAQFLQQGTYGGTSAGIANAQTITIGNVTVYQNIKGVQISWTVGAGLTNTGPAQLNVNDLGLINIYRRNGGALIQLGGGEMPAGDIVKATYDGTQLELDTDYTGGDIVGTIKAVDYSTADPGFLLVFGQCVAEATYPALYAKIGTTHNTADSCSGSNFGLPDLRERTPIGLGNMGGTDPSRITSAVSGFNPTVLGAAGGTQGYGSGIGQTYLQSFTLNTSFSLSSQYSFNGNYASGCCNIPVAQGAGYTNPVTGTITVTSGGSGNPFPTLSPTQIVAYEIKL